MNLLKNENAKTSTDLTDPPNRTTRIDPRKSESSVQQWCVPEPYFFCSKLRLDKRRSEGVVLFACLPWSVRIFYVSLRSLRKSPSCKQL